MTMKKIYFLLLAAVFACLALTSCRSNKANDNGLEAVINMFEAIDNNAIDWKNDPNVGKVQLGYYRRVGVVKDGETYEEMLELLETADRGYLTINDDGTAVFELDGEKTEYVYDEYNFYLTEDTKRTNGYRYTFIGGRLLIDDGSTITQYVKLSDDEARDSDYGVFLSVTENLEALSDFKTVVIDAQYFSKEEIRAFRESGHTVYSYINIGSLEEFRDYYPKYKNITLGEYENWDEEQWIDVSDSRWQDFLIGELIPSLLEKEIDGFFVDNCDVYYQYPTKEIMEGLAGIMSFMVDTGKTVLINGGDTFLDAYCENGGAWDDVITGINQESVFSKILWDEAGFGTASPEDCEYFQSYIERYAAEGADIYLLEYTRDENLIREIREYCKKNGFNYYVSDSLELD